jgi:glycosyltransferase involved in cell wall biosynthesis
MPEKPQKTLLVLFLPQEWKGYHRRSYWEALAIHSTVLVVEPAAGLLTLWFHPGRFIDYLRNLGKLISSGNNTYFFRPFLIGSPGVDFRIPFLAPIDRFLMRLQLQKKIHRLNFKQHEVVIFLVHAQQSLFSALMPKARQCFEITDLYTIAPGYQRIDYNNWYTKRAVKAEKTIISESGLIISSSKLIYEKLKLSGIKAHYLQNSADYGHFSRSAQLELEIPNDIKDIPGPKLGFIGFINHLIDFELLAKLASEFPNASVILIGGEQVETGIANDIWYQRTKSARNIHYLGYKNYRLLPAYLKAFNICLMPFRLNDWMMHSAPNKTYQYLASGKPIVSTDFTEIRQYYNLVYIAKSHPEFVEEVKKALMEKNSELTYARQKAAQENSTEKRAEKVMKLLRDLNETAQGSKPIS